MKTVFDFQKAVNNLRISEYDRNSIGTLKEKILHRTLKEYYSVDNSRPEEKVGSFHADLFLPDTNTVVEIQTGSFYPLKKKIAYYLENTDYNILIVRPLPTVKFLYWIDENDGSVSKPHKSPKKAGILDILHDFLWLSDYIDNPRLSFDLLYMEIDEYRFLSGWSRDKKKGSDRFEYIPKSIIDTVSISCSDDIIDLLPDLPPRFSQKDLSKIFSQKGVKLSALTKFLQNISAIEFDKKESRTTFYKPSEKFAKQA